MKQIIPSLQWLKDANATQTFDTEQLRKHANSIEAMAQAWLNIPATLMSTGQQFIAALDIIERLSPERRNAAERLETWVRRCQDVIHQQYTTCRLERDADQYDIEDRAAFFGEVENPDFADRYADVMIANAQAATGDKGIDNYLAASAALATIEAKSMATACDNDPMILSEDTAYFMAKLPKEETSTKEETKAVEDKPKGNRKQATNEKERK